MKIEIDIKKTRQNAVPPRFETPGAAAADLRAALESAVRVEPGARALIPTGIAVAVPPGYAAFVFARSGLAIKKGLALSNGVGVIDSDYRGEICVGLVNLGEEAVDIAPGDRVAQLAVMPVLEICWNEVGELGETSRGSGGFGSTGV